MDFLLAATDWKQPFIVVKNPDLLQCLQINLLCHSHLLYPAIHILKILHTPPSFSLEDRSTVVFFSLITFLYIVLLCQLIYFIAYALNKVAFLWTYSLCGRCYCGFSYFCKGACSPLCPSGKPNADVSPCVCRCPHDLELCQVKLFTFSNHELFWGLEEAERGLCVF